MKYDKKEFSKYPEVMSKEQFYKICHVAKRTAAYLLKSGLIPNTYTGKWESSLNRTGLPKRSGGS